MLDAEVLGVEPRSYYRTRWRILWSHETANPERMGTDMMSDEMALLTISGGILFAVMVMLTMLMRER